MGADYKVNRLYSEVVKKAARRAGRMEKRLQAGRTAVPL